MSEIQKYFFEFGFWNLFGIWILEFVISVLCTALTPCKHMVSGSISLPVYRVLFTFPSRY